MNPQLWIVGMGAIIPDRLLQNLEVLKGLRALAGIAQKGGGVEDRHGHNAVFDGPLTMLPADLEVLADILHGGDAAQADDDLRADQGDLLLQPAAAGGLLLRERVAVFRGAALDHVGDVDAAPV